MSLVTCHFLLEIRLHSELEGTETLTHIHLVTLPVSDPPSTSNEPSSSKTASLSSSFYRSYYVNCTHSFLLNGQYLRPRDRTLTPYYTKVSSSSPCDLLLVQKPLPVP